MKKIVTLLLVVALCISLAACGNTPGTTATVVPGTSSTVTVDNPTGILKVGIIEASGLFNPIFYSSSYDGYVISLVFDTLIARNFEGKLVGSAAESWTVSEDGKDYTFKLKDGLKFSDGTPVTANDVVFTYKMLADKSYDGRYTTLVQDLKGYADYNAGTTTTFEGVTATDAKTVVFHFASKLRTNLENCIAPIMPEAYYGDGVTVGDISKLKEKSSTPIGSGPYKLTGFEEKQFITLERNMNYTQGGFQIQKILLQFVTDITDIEELMQGNVDLLPGAIAPTKIKRVMDDSNYTLNEYPRSGYGYVKFNCASGPTADKAVRQALYYAFNVTEFVNSYYKLEGTDRVLAGTQYHPFSQLSWVLDAEFLAKLPNYSFDMNKAKQILDDAGWKVNTATGFREKDGKTLELQVLTMPDHAILATLVPMWQRDWGEGLNIKLNVESLEFNTILDYVIYNSDANVDKWSLFFLATSIPTPDPHVMYTEFHSSAIGSGKDNTSRYSNSQVDKLFDDAKSIIDEAEAKVLYQQAAMIIAEDVSIMPVYANTYFDLYSKKLQNFKTSSLYDWVAAMRGATVAPAA